MNKKPITDFMNDEMRNRIARNVTWLLEKMFPTGENDEQPDFSKFLEKTFEDLESSIKYFSDGTYEDEVNDRLQTIDANYKVTEVQLTAILGVELASLLAMVLYRLTRLKSNPPKEIMDGYIDIVVSTFKAGLVGTPVPTDEEIKQLISELSWEEIVRAKEIMNQCDQISMSMIVKKPGFMSRYHQSDMVKNLIIERYAREIEKN